MSTPRWTVFANILSAGTPWIGTSWEFFDSAPAARFRYEELLVANLTPTMRPYHPADKVHAACPQGDADGNPLRDFATWVALHPDVGDTLTAPGREYEFRREARRVLAGLGLKDKT